MLDVSPYTESRVCFSLAHMRHIQEGCPQSCNRRAAASRRSRYSGCYLIAAISLKSLSSVWSWRAELLSDAIIVFSAPLSEAVSQEQQDSKWDVCKFIEEWCFFSFFFSVQPVWGFYHFADLVPGMYQTAFFFKFQRSLTSWAQCKNVKICFLSSSI